MGVVRYLPSWDVHQCGWGGSVEAADIDDDAPINDDAPLDWAPIDDGAPIGDDVAVPSVPGRGWHGVMVLPLSAVVDEAELSIGGVLLIADTGLTRAVTLLEVRSDDSIVVDVG